MHIPTIGVTLAMAVLALVVLLFASSQADAAEIEWTNAADLTLEGKGWADCPGPFHRMPTASVGKISDGVDGLSSNSSGIAVRFVTNSPYIRIKYQLTSPSLALYHMPGTGVSGFDLYVRHNGKWGWIKIGGGQSDVGEQIILYSASSKENEYTLYLPLYNGVKSLEIGTEEGSKIQPAGPRTGGKKSVVFYGSSITQGGCASRPGMAYPAIIGRMLDVPTINLGFSGNGKAEHSLSDFLAELDPSVFVIDCMPNMSYDDVDERIRYMLKTLKSKRPNTPVILVENIIYQSLFVTHQNPAEAEPKNAALRKVYEDEVDNWGGKLYYVKCDNLTGSDGEATVDGVHMTDLGFLRFSEVLAPIIKDVLAKWGK